MKNISLSDPIKGRISEIRLRTDDVLEIKIEEDQSFEKEDMLELIAAAKQLGNGRRLRNLILVGKRTMPSPDAMELSSSEEGSIYKRADAFVISSIGQRMVGNFMLKVQKQAVPTRYFTDLDSAEEWLKQFIRQEVA